MNGARFVKLAAMLALVVLAGAGAVRAERLTYDRIAHGMLGLDHLWAGDESEGILHQETRPDGGYARVDGDGGEATLVELAGPGVVRRVWAATPAVQLRFYVDDDNETPTYVLPLGGDAVIGSTTIAALATGHRAGEEGVVVSLLPVSFTTRCRIAFDRPYPCAWSVAWHAFPEGTSIEPFRVPLAAEDEAALAYACRRLSEPGWHPEMKRLDYEERRVELAPGKRVELRLRGPAVVRDLRVRITSNERDAWRAVTLAAWWDGGREPAVWAPVGPFFAVGVGRSEYASWPVGVDAGTSYCYFPMPFRESARFEIASEAKTPVLVFLRVGYERVEALPETLSYFHAKWRAECGFAESEYPILDCTGDGTLAGTALFVDNVRVDARLPLGAVRLGRDGARLGVNLHDYFGVADTSVVAPWPYYGCSQAIGPYNGFYRWHIADPVRFADGCRLTIENRAVEGTLNDLSSTAYWYQTRPQADFFERVPLEARLPRPISYQRDALQLEAMSVVPLTGGKAVVTSDRELPFDLDAGAGVRLEGRTGDRFRIAAERFEPGVYDYSLATVGDDLLPGYTLHCQGRPITDRLRFTEEERSFELTFDRPGRAGRRGGDRCALILDYMTLAPQRVAVPAWMVIGPWDNPKRTGLDVEYRPEREIVFDATHEGKDGASVRWQKVECGEAARVDLCALLGEEPNLVGYAYAAVVAPATVETQLHAGSDDGIRIWLNDEEVHRVAPRSRTLRLDQDTVDVVLRPGLNPLLVKVEQAEAGWGFAVRFTDLHDQLTFVLDAP